MLNYILIGAAAFLLGISVTFGYVNYHEMLRYRDTQETIKELKSDVIDLNRQMGLFLENVRATAPVIEGPEI